MTRYGWGNVTAGTITKIVLPVIYGGTSLRLLAVLRDSDDPAVRDMAVALAATAAASSTLPPSVLRTFQDTLGDANYARFLSQVGTVVAAQAGNGVLVRSAFPRAEADPRVEHRRQKMFGTLLLMSVIFVRNRSVAGELQQPTELIYQPMPALYWVAFSDFIMQAAGDTARLAFRTSQLTRDEMLQTGLRCVGAGTLAMSGFYGQHAAGILGRLVTTRLPAPLRGVPAQAVIGGAAAVIAVGASLPGFAWRARKWSRTLKDVRMASGLESLWQRFRTDRPEVTLIVGLRHPEVRLYRRVMEILDGLDRLGSQLDPTAGLRSHAETVGRTQGLDQDAVTALARAALVRYAAADGADGTPLRGSSLAGAVPLTGGEVDRDWRQEARRLLTTVDYLRQSPLPDQVLAQAHQADPGRDAADADDTLDDITEGGPTMGDGGGIEVAEGHGDGCTCLEPDSDEVGYVEYAVGRAQAAAFVHEHRRDCTIHGAGATTRP